ncbi:MAG: SdrD B-like domain-containing protein [Cyanobacteria bacterium J06600_6]
MARISGLLYDDNNINGIYEQNADQLVANKEVTLRDGAGNVISSTVTDSNGRYTFDNLPGGDYLISYNPGPGIRFSPKGAGNDGAIDSDVNSNGFSDTISIGDGEAFDGINIGCYKLGRIGDKVFEDTNNNGLQDSNEPGVNGVEVILRTPDGTTVATTTTSGNGDYEFDIIEPGDYQVTFVAPDGREFTTPNAGDDAIDSDADPNTGTTDVFNLNFGENQVTIDAGLKSDTPVANPASLGDKVFFDANGNGLDDGEDGVPDAVVILFDGNGNEVERTTTNGSGNYLFSDLEPGNYQVKFETPAGFDGLTTTNAGNNANDSTDSDANQATGFTDTITLESGENERTIDAGLVRDTPVDQTGSIGDFVFSDTDGDGVQDPDEPSISGVTVTLQNPGGSFVASDTTDPNGEYTFDNVAPGDYKVTVTTPDGFTGFAPVNQGGNDATDSDINPDGMSDVFSVAPNEAKDDVDAGLIPESTAPQLASLGDRIFDDANGNGLQDFGEQGVAGVTVQLQTSEGQTLDVDTTDEQGNYGFDGLTPGDYKINVITPDGFDGFSPQNIGTNEAADSDVDPNNGMSDVVSLAAGENNPNLDAGLVSNPEPQTASLGDRVFNDANGNGIQDPGEQGVAGIPVTVEDRNGIVRTVVTDANGIYTADGLAPGDYKITVDAPDGFGFSPVNQGGNEVTDSDINPATGMSDFVTLNAGENNPNLDAGLVEAPEDPASLGDRVFNDANGNGIQDPGEQGISGVTVQLQTPEGQTLDTDTTDGQGIYGFDNLTPGDYKINVVTPDGFDGFSPQNVGSNEAADSDIDPTNGMSDVVTLVAGQNLNTLDAGLIEAPEETASLGDRIFNDANGNGIQDPGEQGVAGVTVNVEDPNGIVRTIVTDANGIYTADGLAPGDYKITVDAPDGFGFSPVNQGTNEAADSDVDPTTGMSDFVTLAAGQNIDTVDAGLTPATNPVDINPAVNIEKLVRVEGEGGQEGVDLCAQFGDPVGLIFEYVSGPSVNSTAQSIATVSGPAISDANVEVLSLIPTIADPVVFVGGTGKGKGKSKSKSKASKAASKAAKGKGKGGLVFDPTPIGNPTPVDPDGTPVALGNTFVVRLNGLDTLNLEIEGASGTQEITYDASCDSPIRLGDQIGNLRLVGFDGTNSSTRLGGGSTTDVDADTAPGVDALVGNNIVFTYTVDNDGDTPLRLDSVTDDRLGAPTLVGGDTNSNGLLDINETFTYTANETAVAGLRTNTATVNATAVDASGNPISASGGTGGAVVTVTDFDLANYTGVNKINPIEVPNTPIEIPNPNPATPQGDLCDVLGKPISLTFLYRPSNGISTVQEKFELDGAADDDSVAFVVSGGKGKAGKGGKGKGGFTGGITGGQQVTSGETITVGVDGSSTVVSIADDQGGPIIQTVDYHTSCSDIIQLGDQIGSLTLVGYSGEDGSFTLTQDQIDSLPLV